MTALTTAFLGRLRHAALGLCAATLMGLAAAAPVAPPLQPPAPAPKATTDAHAIKGYAMPIGGALKADNDEVWSRLVQLAGGKGARFVVFGTASEDPESSARQVIEQLQRRGAVAEALPVAPKLGWVDLHKVVRDPALIAKVSRARGVFFTGGSQERIVDVLQPGGQSTPMLEAIWEVYRKGGVVAGTSAGAAVMSTVMFRDAPSVISIMKGRWTEGKQIDRGLGFVGPELLIDQHFLKRGRFGRMIPLMLAKGYTLGLGVEENSAAIVHGGEVEVIGGKGALLVDLSQSHSDPALGVLNVQGARLSYLDHGDRYHLASRTATPSALKLRGDKLLPGQPGYKPYYTEPIFYQDMLGDSAISNAMAYLLDSVFDEVRGMAFEGEPQPGAALADLAFALRLYKGPGSVAWSTDEQGPEDYTVLNVYLDIVPMRLAAPLFTRWVPSPQDPPAAGSRGGVAPPATPNSP
ncbi:cyanophycinase [Roseateles sp. BYS180W]|uniref:Cyanophycinase n=1 Tax=Roseateles rivi TaxID=3299028 RepID=A0ABW7FSZ8_9BURK